MKKFLAFTLALTLSTSSVLASNGFEDVFREYHHDISVVWDQQDPAVLKNYEQKLVEDIISMLEAGKSTEELVHASLMALPDLNIRGQIQTALELYRLEKLTKSELANIIIQNSQTMKVTGAGWHPVTKVLVGIAVGYAALQLIMLAIYYSDTDSDYGKPPGGNPVKP
jgi:uncharacterized protein (DUF433 family)